MRLAVALAAVLATGCAKREPEPTPAKGSGSAAVVEILPPAERSRAEQACDGYVKRVCGCAERDAATWAEKCQLSRAMPEALALSLDVASHPDTTAQSLTQLQQGARKLVARCLEETAALDAKGCR